MGSDQQRFNYIRLPHTRYSADVVGGDDGVNFQDSYEILAYLQGVTTVKYKLHYKAQVQFTNTVVSKKRMVAYSNGSVTFNNTFTAVDSDQSSKNYKCCTWSER